MIARIDRLITNSVPQFMVRKSPSLEHCKQATVRHSPGFC